MSDLPEGLSEQEFFAPKSKASKDGRTIYVTHPSGQTVELLGYRRRPNLDFIIMTALPKTGRKGTPGSLRKKRSVLIQRDGNNCHYCGVEMLFPNGEDIKGDRSKPRLMTIEHVVARAHGGPNAINNLVLACHKCNNGFGDERIKCRCHFCNNAIRLYGGNL